MGISSPTCMEASWLFKTIKEGTAIYYLADTKISDGEFLKFDIKVTPEGETHPVRLHFDKRFFTY